MNLPNILTISRIGFAAILVYLLLLNSLMGNVLAVIFFAVASITDFYDGYLAKKRGLISDFGKIMDPIADKVLMLSLLFVLAFLGMVNWLMVALIAVREIVVTIDRLIAMKSGLVLAAEKAGKVKTVFQMATVSIILLYLVLEQADFSRHWIYKIQNFYLSGINLMMTLTLILTLASGVAYFQNKLKTQKI